VGRSITSSNQRLGTTLETLLKKSGTLPSKRNCLDEHKIRTEKAFPYVASTVSRIHKRAPSSVGAAIL
jgi:hypothetical protein